MTAGRPDDESEPNLPDSVDDAAEEGALTQSLDGQLIEGATITAFQDGSDSGDGASDYRTTTNPGGPSTDRSTGRTSDATGLLSGRLSKPHVGHEKYVASQELGRGGMGVVKRALDIDLRRDVAMKVMLPDPRESKYARFMEEAQVTGQLEHPNIVPVHDLGVDRDGWPFFTMKLVDGQPMSELLARLRKGDRKAIEAWPLGRLLSAFLGICNGIAYAHEHGVVHRDLKPANIMLGGFGEVQVMDWGLAKIGAVRHAGKRVQSLRDDLIRRATHRQRKDGDNDAEAVITPPVDERPELDDADNPFETQMGDRAGGTMTHDGSVMGTPVYMPPEQARGAIDEIDERSDVYSLGAILYEILTLKAPVSGDSARAILERVKKGEIIAPERRTPDRTIPAECSAIAMKALARDPEHRYQRVDELRRDIELFIQGRTVSAKEDSAMEAFIKLVKRNKPVSLAVAIAVLLLAITVATGFSVILRYWSAAEASRDDARQALARAEESRDQARQALADFKREQALRAEAEQVKQQLQEQMKEESHRNWHLIRDERFGPGTFEHWRATTGWAEPRLLDAADRREWLSFKPDGMHVTHNREVLHLVYDEPVGDSIRLEVDVTALEQSNSGIHISLRGSAWNRGYIFQFGGWNNTRAAILRGNSSNPRVLTERPFTLEAGRRYTFEAYTYKSIEGMHLALRIDGHQVLSTLDPDPLLPSSDGDCTIWVPAPAAAALHWSRVSVLGAPLKEDLLATADRHLGKGNYQTAFDLYQEVAEAGFDPTRIDLAKEGMARTRELLAAADKITKWRNDLKRVWHKQEWSLDLSEGLLSCSVSGDDIKHLNPLRGLPLNRLILYHTTVSDLKILRGMQLTNLEISGGRIRELDPLADLPIVALSITGNPIRSLGPLATLPQLNQLDLSDCSEISDLSPLIACSLETLLLNNCTGITDLAPLRGSGLHHLEISGIGTVANLDQLDGLPLRSIRIDRRHIEMLLVTMPKLPQLERIIVSDDAERPTGYRPDEFWQRYGIGNPLDEQIDEDDPYYIRRPIDIDLNLPFTLDPAVTNDRQVDEADVDEIEETDETATGP